MEVYIIYEMAYSGNSEAEIIGVFADKDKALEKYNSEIEANIKDFDYIFDNECNNTKINENTNMTRLFKGNQQENWDNYLEIFIEKRKVIENKKEVVKNKYYELNCYGKKYRVKAIKTKYSSTNNLGIILLTDKDEPFTTLTVNIPEIIIADDQALIDTNNNKWAEEFIKNNNLGIPSGWSQRSGWCDYPAYTFDLSKLEEY